MKLIFAFAASVAALASPLSAAAQSGPLEPGRWSGTLMLGSEFPVDGDVHGGATAPVADLGALNPGLAGVAAELRIQSRSFDDIYGEMNTYGVAVARGLEGEREVFAALRRTEADDGRVQVGTAFVPALTASLPVFGDFGEFTQTSLEVGARQFFSAGAFRPYVGGRVGAAFTDAIRATFTIPSAPAGGIAIRNVAFYDDSTALSAGLDLGVEFALGEMGAIGIETGLRFAGDLSDDDSAIGGLGLASINDEGARTSIPLSVKGVLRF